MVVEGVGDGEGEKGVGESGEGGGVSVAGLVEQEVVRAEAVANEGTSVSTSSGSRHLTPSSHTGSFRAIPKRPRASITGWTEEQEAELVQFGNSSVRTETWEEWANARGRYGATCASRLKLLRKKAGSSLFFLSSTRGAPDAGSP